jgi:broad specificity phosphatase PhoE
MGLVLLTVAFGFDRAFPADGPSVSPRVGPHIVLIIRHAEKPEPSTDGTKDPNLNKQGYERAEALAKAIPAHFPKPDFLIATKKSSGSNRPVETITPLANAWAIHFLFLVRLLHSRATR